MPQSEDKIALEELEYKHLDVKEVLPAGDLVFDNFKLER